MRRRRPVPRAPLVLLALGLSCAPREGSGVLPSGSSLPVRTDELFGTTESCHGEDRTETVLRSPAGWRAWWAAATCEAGPLPAVDFATSMVLAVGDRAGPNGCYAVRIAEVRPTVGGSYRVVVDRHVPSRSQACTLTVVRPAHAVRVPAARGAVVFEWRTVTGAAR